MDRSVHSIGAQQGGKELPIGGFGRRDGRRGGGGRGRGGGGRSRSSRKCARVSRSILLLAHPPLAIERVHKSARQEDDDELAPGPLHHGGVQRGVEQRVGGQNHAVYLALDHLQQLQP